MALNFAEIERRLIGQRTKAAMDRIRSEKHVGRPRALAAETTKLIVHYRDEGKKLRQIAQRLTEEAIPAASGAYEWTPSKVQSALKSLTARGEYRGDD